MELTKNQKIGIGIGISIAVIGTIAAIVYFRNKDNNEQNNDSTDTDRKTGEEALADAMSTRPAEASESQEKA